PEPTWVVPAAVRGPDPARGARRRPRTRGGWPGRGSGRARAGGSGTGLYRGGRDRALTSGPERCSRNPPAGRTRYHNAARLAALREPASRRPPVPRPGGGAVGAGGDDSPRSDRVRGDSGEPDGAG